MGISVEKWAQKALYTGIVAFLIAGVVGFVVILQAIMSRGASLAQAPINDVFVGAYFVDMTALVVANALETRL